MKATDNKTVAFFCNSVFFNYLCIQNNNTNQNI